MPDSAPPSAEAGQGLHRLGRRGLRRIGAQAGLIAALVAVFTVCAATSGICLLLLTAGDQRALSAAVAHADGTESTVGPDLTTLLVLADGESDVKTNAATLLPLIRNSLLTAAAPYQAQVTTWVSSPSLLLDGPDVRRGYLVEADSMADNATLRSGTWPTRSSAGQPIPAAVPVTTATALGLRIGDTLRLVSARGGGPGTSSYNLIISGIFTPAETSAWERDELRGRGYDPSHFGVPTFGPFVIAPGTLESLGAPIDQITAILDPDLAGDAAGIPALLQRLGAVPTQLKDEVGPAVGQVIGRSALGAEFEKMRSTLRVTDSLMATVFLLILALGAATTALIARVLAGRRAAESTLLRDRGASTPQLMLSAATEALAIAVAGTVLAAPLALAGYRLTATDQRSWWPAGSGTAELWNFGLALFCGAALPAVVVVISLLPERPRRGRHPHAGVLVRSGADLMLAVIAVAAYLQLYSHVPTPGVLDPFLAGAPAICALAVAALLARLLPLIARAAEAAAGRARGLVLPLAGWHLARGGAVHGVFLLVLATAVATLGSTFLATWSTSQEDQAAAQVGTDLVVSRPGGPDTGRRLRELTGSAAAPVADQAVVLGSRPDGVKLLALPSQDADRLLVSRPPADTSWSQVMAGLTPQTDGNPLAVGAGPSAITVTGSLRSAAPPAAGQAAPVVTATPTLVLVDEAGSTITEVGAAVTLDGHPHTSELPQPGQAALPDGDWRIVAIDLMLVDQTKGGPSRWDTTNATIGLNIQVAGATSTGGDWSAAADSGNTGARPSRVSATGDTVATSLSYSAYGLSYQDAHLTLLSFPASVQVPVAMTEKLAGELGLAVGDRIELSWDTATLEAVVVRTIPYVPTHVREAALLTDLDSLQRALLSAGRLDSITTAWWVGSPDPGAAQATRDAGQGPVLDRAETAAEMRDGPLRAPLQFAWLLAIAVAVGLAITGSAAQATAQAQQSWVTIARVRAIGTSRREALASHLVQHAAVTLLGTLLGAAGGTLLAATLVPLLMLTPTGETAVPAATLSWSVGPTAAVVGAILVGGLLAGIPSSLAMIGRSTVAALRMGEAP